MADNRILVAFIAVVAAAVLIAGQSPTDTGIHEGLGRIFAEFHDDESERNIPTHLPDAEIVFRENRTDHTNTTMEFRYYYSEEADTTVVACAREATLAICPGNVAASLDKEHLGECMIHPSVVYNIENQVFK